MPFAGSPLRNWRHFGRGSPSLTLLRGTARLRKMSPRFVSIRSRDDKRQTAV